MLTAPAASILPSPAGPQPFNFHSHRLVSFTTQLSPSLNCAQQALAGRGGSTHRLNKQQHHGSPGCQHSSSPGCWPQTRLPTCPTTGSRWYPTSRHPKSPATKPGVPALAPVQPRSRTYGAGRMKIPKRIPKAASFPAPHAPSQVVQRQEEDTGVPALCGSSRSRPTWPWGQDRGRMGSCPAKPSPLPKARGLLISFPF